MQFLGCPATVIEHRVHKSGLSDKFIPEEEIMPAVKFPLILSFVLLNAFSFAADNNFYYVNGRCQNSEGISGHNSAFLQPCADLSGANLEKTDLRYHDLRGVIFDGAWMDGVKIRGANFEGASFRGVWMRSADGVGNIDFSNCDLRDGHFYGTISLNDAIKNQVQLTGSLYNTSSELYFYCGTPGDLTCLGYLASTLGMIRKN